jgi:hypothetical protein
MPAVFISPVQRRVRVHLIGLDTGRLRPDRPASNGHRREGARLVLASNGTVVGGRPVQR